MRLTFTFGLVHAEVFVDDETDDVAGKVMDVISREITDAAERERIWKMVLDKLSIARAHVWHEQLGHPRETHRMSESTES